MKYIITESQYGLIKENKNKKFLTNLMGVDFTDKIQQITSSYDVPMEFDKSISPQMINRGLNKWGPMYLFELDGMQYLYQDRFDDDGNFEFFMDEHGFDYVNGEIPEQLGIDIIGLNFSDIVDLYFNEEEPLNENVDDKKIKVMEKYIDGIFSDYDWYEGIDSVKVEKFRLSGNDKRSIPLYVFYVTTNDYKKSYHEYKEEFYNTSIYDEIDDMFGSLFPYDKPGHPSAVWVVRWVML